MKSTIFNTMACFLLLSLLASCGKKNSSGSSKNPNVGINTNSIQNGSSSGEAAWNLAKAWLDSADNTPVGLHAAYLKKSVSSNFSFTVGMCKNTLIGNPFCEAPTGCFKRTSNAVMIGVVKMIGSDNKRYSDCDINTTFSIYQKSSDQNLKDAILGKAGFFVIKSMTQQSGSIFTIYFGSFDGSTSPIAMAKINTSLPAIMNPVNLPTSSNQETRLVDYLFM
jgi:hypothetical protein